MTFASRNWYEEMAHRASQIALEHKDTDLESPVQDCRFFYLDFQERDRLACTCKEICCCHWFENKLIRFKSKADFAAQHQVCISYLQLDFQTSQRVDLEHSKFMLPPNPRSNSRNQSETEWQHKIFDRLYLVVCDEYRAPTECIPLENICYECLSDDEPPINLGMVVSFANGLHDFFQAHDATTIVAVHSVSDPVAVSKTLFLLGSYLILIRDCLPDDVAAYCKAAER